MEDFPSDFNIIPVRNNSTEYDDNKKPLIYWKDYQVKKFPREELDKFPECNYAVICGSISNNLVVIDLDYKTKNNYLDEIYPRFNADLGELSNTYTEHTPKGTHIFYYINGECPKRKTHKNSSDKDVIEKLKRTTKTKFSEYMDGIDILGENGYCIIHPSKNIGMEYTKGMPFAIKKINLEQFEKIKSFFLLEKWKHDKLRKGFEDILFGKIEIESYAKSVEQLEMVYWKFLYIEAWNRLGLKPQQLFNLLKKNQPSFDLEKTLTQLEHHSYDQKPLTNKKYNEYFPNYKITERKIKQTNIPDYITIADYLMNKYEIMTISNMGIKGSRTDDMMIRHGNVCTHDLSEFKKDMAIQIEACGKSIVMLSANVIKRIKYMTQFNINDLCYDEWTINFHNGYLKLDTMEFYPNDKFNNKMFPYEIPHDYMKDSKKTCPKFKTLLREWLSEQSTITEDDMFEMIGYSMTMNVDQKMAFFIYGPTDTGKTQFQTALENIIGHDNRTEVSLQRLAKDHFGAQGLSMKLLNMVGDMSDITPNDTSKFKELTGDDKYVGAEVKGGSPYQFRNIIKIWYNGNIIPILLKDDKAFYGRWILIYFGHEYPKFSDNTIRKIGENTSTEEMEGIINECIKGALRLKKRKHFRKEIIHDTEHRWRYESEPMYKFLKDRTIRRMDGEINKFEFRDEYNRFVYSRKERPLSSQALTLLLEKYGVFEERLQHNNIKEYYYVGIEWKDNKKEYDKIQDRF